MKKESDTSETLSAQVSVEIEHETSSPLANTRGKGGLAGKVEKTKTRQKNYTMDLRIHSPASLGYLGIEGLDTAPALVRLARVKGLDVIAVTDFYSGDYIDRITEASKNTSVTVIPGVDLRVDVGGCNEVTLSCLFKEGFSTQGINEFLRAIDVPTQARGDRSYIVQAPFKKVLEYVDYFQGLALPSRVDKTPHRMRAIPTLVEEYGFRAFDLAYPDTERFFKKSWPKMKFHLFSFSNANALAQVGSRTARIKMATPGFEGLKDIVSRTGSVEAPSARK